MQFFKSALALGLCTSGTVVHAAAAGPFDFDLSYYVKVSDEMFTKVEQSFAGNNCETLLKPGETGGWKGDAIELCTAFEEDNCEGTPYNLGGSWDDSHFVRSVKCVLPPI